MQKCERICKPASTSCGQWLMAYLECSNRMFPLGCLINTTWAHDPMNAKGFFLNAGLHALGQYETSYLQPCCKDTLLDQLARCLCSLSLLCCTTCTCMLVCGMNVAVYLPPRGMASNMVMRWPSVLWWQSRLEQAGITHVLALQ